MTTGPDSRPVPTSFDEEDELEPTRVRDSLTGKKAGEYLLGARIGQGAMGVVYKGTHPLLGREAAIKVLQSESDDAAEKLLGEARAVAQARHPNIIDIFGFGTTEGGQPYFVMELLEGEALDVWLRNRPPLTPREVVGILKQLFSGLAAAHAANVIHRDLKPSNLFMAKLADGTHFLKILDFGLSKRVDPANPNKTHGSIVGTPLYMAPEQTVGDPSTPATDLYAAGCIAYELITGHPPFMAESVAELLRHQREMTPPPLPDTVPPTLRELVLALLIKVPANRPASASDARAMVERVERKIIVSSPSGTLPRDLVAPPRDLVAPPRASRPPGPKSQSSRPPPAERPTVPLPLPPPVAVSPGSGSGPRKAFTASQERETVRMEPLKMELPARPLSAPKLAAVAGPRPAPEVTNVRQTDTALHVPEVTPTAVVKKSSRLPLIIVVVVGLVLVAVLISSFWK